MTQLSLCAYARVVKTANPKTGITVNKTKNGRLQSEQKSEFLLKPNTRPNKRKTDTVDKLNLQINTKTTKTHSPGNASFYVSQTESFQKTDDMRKTMEREK